MVIISHKVSIISQIDKIVVLANGQASLFGPRDEVLKQLADSNKALQNKTPKQQAKPAISKVKPSIPV